MGTYDLIEEKVIGTAVNVVTFSSIPGTYKDLILEIANVSTGWMYGRVNGDTAANYSGTRLQGNGTSATSSRGSNLTTVDISVDWGSAGTGAAKMQFFSYANTSVYKTILNSVGVATTTASVNVSLWRSTSAITSISLYPDGYTGYNFGVGSVFRLWGVS